MSRSFYYAARAWRRCPVLQYGALVSVLAACGPVAETMDTGDGSDSSGAASTGTDPTLGGTATEPPAATTLLDSGTDDGPGYEEDDGGTGCTFTCPDPPPPPPPPGGASECDLVVQDCPEGEQCVPWANDGGGVWNANRCVPVFDDEPLDAPCMAEGSAVSGIDTCDFGLLCWDVNPETLEGTCAALCGDTKAIGPCEAEGTSCVEIDGVPLCVSTCDPVTPICPEGEGCFASNDGFYCRPPLLEAVDVGEPCDDRAGCLPGLLCAHGTGLECEGEPGQGCCAAACDINAPDGCAEPGQACVPWFPIGPPAGLEHLGSCGPA